VGWGAETEGKPLNQSNHRRLSSWDFRGKKAYTDGDVIPEMRFRCRMRTGEEEHGLLPAAQGKDPRVLSLVTVVLAHCGSLALGHLLKAVQSIRWHIREQKAISAAGLLLLKVLVASSGLSVSQVCTVSQGIFFF